MDERKAKMAEFYKKSKKKPKTEDEELKDIEDLRNKTILTLSS